MDPSRFLFDETVVLTVVTTAVAVVLAILTELELVRDKRG